MTIDIKTDLTAFIARDGANLITDSRAVAIAFGKQHKHVMRTIKAMHESEHPEIAEHARSNFGPCFYVDTNDRQRPMYRMTADGLTELAMGFSGDKSRIVRIRFIAAFHEVARRLESADKTIAQMLHDHDKRAAVSETKGRIGSLLMHGRRKEKPALKDEEASLKSLSQPPLFLN